jgi:hypothetical protein
VSKITHISWTSDQNFNICDFSIAIIFYQQKCHTFYAQHTHQLITDKPPKPCPMAFKLWDNGHKNHPTTSLVPSCFHPHGGHQATAITSISPQNVVNVWPCPLVQKQQSNNQSIICNQQPSPINLLNVVNWHMTSAGTGTETAING